jgi:hypothetical protein
MSFLATYSRLLRPSFFSCGTVWNQPTGPQATNVIILKFHAAYSHVAILYARGTIWNQPTSQ